MSYIIHKIKFDGLGLKIKFDEYNEGRVKECDIGFSEPPKPSFSDTFSSLIFVAHEVMGLNRIKITDDKNGINLIRCNGIEFKQKSDGTKAARLFCEYYSEQADAYTAINTPFLLFAQIEEENGRKGFFTEDQQEIIQTVYDETVNYLKGERAQITLEEAAEEEEIDRLRQAVEAGKAAINAGKSATPFLN